MVLFCKAIVPSTLCPIDLFREKAHVSRALLESPQTSNEPSSFKGHVPPFVLWLL